MKKVKKVLYNYVYNIYNNACTTETTLVSVKY